MSLALEVVGPDPYPSLVTAHGPQARVWRLDLADTAWDVAAETELLSRAERDRAARGVPGVQRRRILLRAALRRLLGGLLELPAHRVPIAVVDGRPHLTAAAGSTRPDVSCSASGDVGLIALAWGAPVGVDVQRHDEEEALRSFGEGWLTTAEQAALSRLPRADRLPAVTRCWTQKEAVLKGLGVGLRQSPATVGTPVADAGRCGDWSLSAVGVPPGYVGSLAVRAPSFLAEVPVVELTASGVR
jgi:4'-phosphopantetheinyl transferase